METFSALLAICAGNSLGTSEFSAQKPVTQSFDVFFDLCLNKWLRKQWWGWWFEIPSCPLWHHCNGVMASGHMKIDEKGQCTCWIIFCHIFYQFKYIHDYDKQEILCFLSTKSTTFDASSYSLLIHSINIRYWMIWCMIIILHCWNCYFIIISF